MTDLPNRGQSSIVGSILLLGLVVVGTTLVGGYGLYTLTQAPESSEHFVDCEIEYVDLPSPLCSPIQATSSGLQLTPRPMLGKRGKMAMEWVLFTTRTK